MERSLPRRSHHWLLRFSLIAAGILAALDVLSHHGFVRLIAFCPAPNSACGLYLYSGLVGAEYGVVEDFDTRKNFQYFWSSPPPSPAWLPFFYPARKSHMLPGDFVFLADHRNGYPNFPHKSSAWYVVCPVWTPLSLLLAYPLLRLYRSVFRRWWRFEHGRCPGCGYDLRGNTSGRCPECGEDKPGAT